MGTILLVAAFALAVVLIAKQFLTDQPVSTPRTFPAGGFGGGGAGSEEGSGAVAALSKADAGQWNTLSVETATTTSAAKKRAKKAEGIKPSAKRNPAKKTTPKKATKSTRKSS